MKSGLPLSLVLLCAQAALPQTHHDVIRADIQYQVIENFGASAKGMKVEIIGGDHQNKPDIGLSVARQWFDVDGVDAIADVPTSSVAPSTRLIRAVRLYRRCRRRPTLARSRASGL